MASVRIEDEAFVDERIELLGVVAGYNRYEALGRLAHLWRICTERGAYAVSDITIVACLGLRGVEAILAADLAERTEDGIRVRGTDGRIEWLKQSREFGKIGGRKSAELRSRKKEGGVDLPLEGASREPQGILENFQGSGNPRVNLPTPTLNTEEETPLPPETGGGGAAVVSPNGRPRKRRDPAVAESDPRFARFWAAYPRHEKRADAARAFARIDPSPELLDRMLAAIAAQTKGGCLEPRTVEGRDMRPHPTSWLNSRRWEDEATKPNPPTESATQAANRRHAEFARQRREDEERMRE